jgi:hypothetical protein
MEKYILDAYMDKASIPTGALSIKYDFITGYGVVNSNYVNGVPTQTDGVIYNQVYSTGTQHYIEDELHRVISNYSPALTMINSPHRITGSGFFEGSGVLKITNEIKDDTWTAFFKLKPYLVNKDRSKGQVLLSTIESGAADISGFRFGINGANKLFFEHPNNLSHEDLRVSTLANQSLSTENIISVSYDGNLAEISSHNFDPDETERDYVDLSGYNKSDQWYIGNNISFPNKNIDPFYTGYSGYLNDFIYFNEYLTIDQKDTIAESFFVESYVAETTGEITGLFNLVTGSEISGIFLESGITGYEVKKKEDVEQEGGGLFRTYFLSGVSGAISGDVIVELTGSDTGAFSEVVTIAEQIEYDEELISRVNKEYNSFIVLNRSKVDTDDSVEIYSRSVESKNINLRPIHDSDSDSANARFDLDIDEGDFVNLYHNGILLAPPSVDSITGDRTPVEVRDESNVLQGEAYELDYRSIKSGQRYYFDANIEADYPDVYPGTVMASTGTPEWALENNVYGVSKGYITAGRDGLSIFHMDSASAYIQMFKTIDGVTYENSDWSLINYGGIKSTLKLDIGNSGEYEIYDNNKIKNTEDSYSFVKNDALLYDKATGNHNYYVFTGAGMDASTSITIDNKNIKDVIVLSGDAYVNKNIFVNGMKMISGTFSELEAQGMEVEYTWGSHDINGVTVDASIISTSGFSNYTLGGVEDGVGTLLSTLAEKNDLSLLQFVPHVTESFTGFTGEGRVDYEIGLESASEQLWFNGQRGVPPDSEFSDLTVSDVTVSYIKVNKDGLGNIIPQTYLDFATNVSSLNDVHQGHPSLTRIFDQEFKFGFDISVPPTGEKYFAITPV